MHDIEPVVHGDWADNDWMAAARKPAAERSPVEKLAYDAGPRQHPWGPCAVLHETKDAPALWFPSDEARDGWIARRDNGPTPVVEPAVTE